MGRNQRRDEICWPPAGTVHERWFLRCVGSRATGGPQATERPSEFRYDPMDPEPTVGGNTVMWSGYPAGPMNQARVEARPDVLVFTSDPLEDDLEVTGRVRGLLHAESSAPSTDWVARLCDVHPDGPAVNLCDGILRVTEGAQETDRVRSTCGRRATSSCAAIGSVGTSPADCSHGGIAISTRAISANGGTKSHGSASIMQPASRPT